MGGKLKGENYQNKQVAFGDMPISGFNREIKIISRAIDANHFGKR